MRCRNCGRPIFKMESDHRGALAPEEQYWMHKVRGGGDASCGLSAQPAERGILLRVETTPEWLAAVRRRVTADELASSANRNEGPGGAQPYEVLAYVKALLDMDADAGSFEGPAELFRVALEARS